jgi:hypothetical protein
VLVLRTEMEVSQILKFGICVRKFPISTNVFLLAVTVMYSSDCLLLTSALLRAIFMKKRRYCINCCSFITDGKTSFREYMIGRLEIEHLLLTVFIRASASKG